MLHPAGEIVRKLRVETRDNDLAAAGIRSYAGRLAIVFDRPASANANVAVSVLDLRGNPISSYSVAAPGDTYSLALACYSSKGLTMVPVRSDPELYLLRANLP
jgi:hypothetical protein